MLLVFPKMHKQPFSAPQSESTPSLINQDAYPLMHRDEQSAWQAGSYSFLTPANGEWCNRTAGPLPFPSLTVSSHLCTLPLTLLPGLLFLAHSLSSLFSFLSLSSLSHFCSPIHWLPLFHPLDISPTQRPMFPCLHYTQLLPSINYMPTPLLTYPLPFLCSMTTTPTILHTHLSLQPPCLTSHPLGQLSVPPHTLVLLPLLPFSLPSKLTPPVAVSHSRCP